MIPALDQLTAKIQEPIVPLESSYSKHYNVKYILEVLLQSNLISFEEYYQAVKTVLFPRICNKIEKELPYFQASIIFDNQYYQAQRENEKRMTPSCDCKQKCGCHIIAPYLSEITRIRKDRAIPYEFVHRCDHGNIKKSWLFPLVICDDLSGYLTLESLSPTLIHKNKLFIREYISLITDVFKEFTIYKGA